MPPDNEQNDAEVLLSTPPTSGNIYRGDATPSPRQPLPGEFNLAMVHFYRGEMQRSNTWRNRLDITTNWAVLTAGASLSFAFSSPTNPHVVIIINSALVALFLFMEARRYRYYEIWSRRVRLIETGYFAQLLAPNRASDQKWAETMSNDLLVSQFTITVWEALGRRLRRNYLCLFILLAASWNFKVYVHPRPAASFAEFVARAGIGLVPGSTVISLGLIFNVGMLILAVATLRLRQATGEFLPQHHFALHPIQRVTDWTPAMMIKKRATRRRTKRARARVSANSSIGTRKFRGDAVPVERDP